MTRPRFAVVALLVAVIVGTLGMATRFVSADTAIFGAQTSASPEASPIASPAATGATATIDMIDIAFKPNAFTIPANTDVAVSITNKGVTTHTFIINDHKNDGKPNLNINVSLAPGATQTITINAPAGDYYFWCDIPGHEAAGMFGTLTVQ